MKTKYADLINQLERVTKAYEAALAAVKALEKTTRELPDVAGVSGGVNYFGDDFEKNRTIHLDAKVLTDAAVDCGSGFQCEDWDEFTRVECTIFGYRVCALAHKADTAYLLDLAAVERKANE